MTPLQAVDRTIANLKARVAKLEAAREALADEDVQRAIAGDKKRTVRRAQPKGPRQGKATVFERLVTYFDERGNEWATLEEIKDATGIPVSSIRNAVYKTNVEAFDRQSQAGGGRPTRFRHRSSSAT